MEEMTIEQAGAILSKSRWAKLGPEERSRIMKAVAAQGAGRHKLSLEERCRIMKAEQQAKQRREKREAKRNLSQDAVLMAQARWANVSAEERTRHAKIIRQAPGSGQQRSKERCYCGENSLNRATQRSFDCCKRAGVFPSQAVRKQVVPVRKKRRAPRPPIGIAPLSNSGDAAVSRMDEAEGRARMSLPEPTKARKAIEQRRETIGAMLRTTDWTFAEISRRVGVSAACVSFIRKKYFPELRESSSPVTTDAATIEQRREVIGILLRQTDLSLAQIAQRIGISREGVRRIQAKYFPKFGRPKKPKRQRLCRRIFLKGLMRILRSSGAMWCSACHQVKCLEDFSPFIRKGKNGKPCKKCNAAKMNAWYWKTRGRCGDSLGSGDAARVRRLDAPSR